MRGRDLGHGVRLVDVVHGVVGVPLAEALALYETKPTPRDSAIPEIAQSKTLEIVSVKYSQLERVHAPELSALRPPFNDAHYRPGVYVPYERDREARAWLRGAGRAVAAEQRRGGEPVREGREEEDAGGDGHRAAEERQRDDRVRPQPVGVCRAQAEEGEAETRGGQLLQES